MPEGIRQTCGPPKAPQGIPDRSVTFFRRSSTIGGLRMPGFSQPFPGFE